MFFLDTVSVENAIEYCDDKFIQLSGARCHFLFSLVVHEIHFEEVLTSQVTN